MDYRIGFGYDVHRLAEGRELFIGGIRVPHDRGALAHSDGDVLIHAICDALLGALGLGDIGQHFPDSSPEFKGMDSKILLTRTIHMIHMEGYVVNNLDTVVMLEKPRITEHIPAMREVLAARLKTDTAAVSIKATTTEKLGFTGREEGIAASAVVLLKKS
jgi:2-C-methyl-D-erythritol 2,4-cyclodiphosphate synthase